MKRKIIIVIIVIVVIIFLLQFVEKKTEGVAVDTKDKLQLDISAIQSDIYVNQFKVKESMQEYLIDNEIKCKKATAIKYKYQDLETADIVYDIFFLLDDKDKTLLTMSYYRPQNSAGIDIKIKPSEYTLDEIKSEAWYKEDYQ